MYASLCGYPETAKVLIQANADVDSVDNTGLIYIKRDDNSAKFILQM